MWDGVERREVVKALEQAQGNAKGFDIRTTILIVGFFVLAMLQAGAIFGHDVIADRQQKAKESDERIECFVVGITQGKAGADLLTACGFLKLGGS